MLVQIDPPIVGQEFGLGAQDVNVLILAPRLEGYSLFPISNWPCPVHCVRIVQGNPSEGGFISGKCCEIVDNIWPTEAEAQSHRITS